MLRLPDINALWPGTCVFCRLLPASEGICQACRSDLPTFATVCARCAEPLVDATGERLICARCQRLPPPWRDCRSALPYAWPVDVALQRLKFSRQLVFAAALGEMLAQTVIREFPDVDALCPVPLHRWRQLMRGFNQAQELCRPIQKRTALPIVSNVSRSRHTAAQSGLGRRARRKNLQDAFRIRGVCEYRHPLIVDDIMTTGETVRQLAQLLLDNGAEAVSVLTAARASYANQAGVAEKV